MSRCQATLTMTCWMRGQWNPLWCWMIRCQGTDAQCTCIDAAEMTVAGAAAQPPMCLSWMVFSYGEYCVVAAQQYAVTHPTFALCIFLLLMHNSALPSNLLEPSVMPCCSPHLSSIVNHHLLLQFSFCHFSSSRSFAKDCIESEGSKEKDSSTTGPNLEKFLFNFIFCLPYC